MLKLHNTSQNNISWSLKPFVGSTAVYRFLACTMLAIAGDPRGFATLAVWTSCHLCYGWKG